VRLAAKVLALGTSIVLARMLGASGFGAYAFAMALIGIMAIPVELGLPHLIIREVAVYRRRGQLALLKGLLLRANQVVALLAITLAVIAGMFLYFVNPAEHASSTSTLLWALPLLPLLGLSTVRAAALRGLGWVASEQFVQAVLRPILFLAMIGLVAWILPTGAVTDTTAIQIQIGAVTATFFLGIWLLAFALPGGIRAQRAQYDDRRWFTASLPFLLLAGAQIMIQHTDTIMLGMLATSADVGIYRIVSQGAMLVIFAHTAVSTVIEPHIAHLNDAGSRAKLQQLVVTAARASLVGAVPVAALFMIFGREFLVAIFGEEFGRGYVPLVILSLGHLFNAAMGSVGLILNMSGHVWYSAAGVVVAASVNIMGNAFLIPLFGMTGAAIASAISLIIWNILLAYWVFKRTGLVTARFRRPDREK
jgi:O-antigen/teichoic acid export membrane protein